MFTETRKENLTETVIQRESTNYLMQHGDLSGDGDKIMSEQQRAENNRNKKCLVVDVTHGRERSEVHVSAAETYPKIPNKCKHEVVDMTTDISNKSPASKCIPDAEITQLQNDKVCNRQNEKQALDCHCEDEAQCKKSTALQELEDDCKESNKDNKRRLLDNSSQKQAAQGREQMEVQELEDYKQKNKDIKMTLPEDSSGRLKRDILEIEYAYTEDNKNNHMRLLNNSPEKHEVQGTGMMKLCKLGYDQTESNNKDYEIQSLEETSVKVQDREIIKLQELGCDYKGNKGNLVQLVDDFSEKCQTHGRRTMKAQELGAVYKRSELQGEDKHVRGTATVTKISSVSKQMVSTMQQVNALGECQLRYKATDQNKEYAKQKTPTLETKCDNREQVEKVITEEVNRDTKETVVMAHNDTERVEKTTEMLVHDQKKEEARAIQIKRYVNSSLELQLTNQDK
jgi:hypothetical protein